MAILQQPSGQKKMGNLLIDDNEMNHNTSESCTQF